MSLSSPSVFHRLPNLLVQGDVFVTRRCHFNDGESARVDELRYQALKVIPVLCAMIRRAKRTRHRLKIEAVGGAKEGFKVARQVGLGQKGEDAAAVVVHQDDEKLQPMLLGGEQPPDI